MTTTASRNGSISSETLEQFKAQQREIRALKAKTEQLRVALESRIIIEQAKGAISARCGITPDDAFAMMRGLARSQRRDIHGYAAEIVANGGRFSAEQ